MFQAIMAGLTRSAKSGSDWTSNDLAAYNIIVHRQSAAEFFGCQPDTIPKTIDPDFLTATMPLNDNLSDTTYQLLQYIHLATNANFGQESAIYDVARELLRLLGFEERGTLLRSRFPIPFVISADGGRVAQADLCLMQGSSTILLVLQQDKTAISSKNHEAQVIAQGIAAFQYNNAIRNRAGLDTLETMIIPAITMIGTRPIFYKTLVTRDAVAMAQYPATQTTVLKCIVAPRSRRLSEGIEAPEFRQDILKFMKLSGRWRRVVGKDILSDSLAVRWDQVIVIPLCYHVHMLYSG